MQESDALLLGRTTYDIVRPYWPGQHNEIARAFNRVPKYVASRGTPDLTWEPSTRITDAGAEVRDLRERHEQIRTWGSANLLQRRISVYSRLLRADFTRSARIPGRT